MGLDQVRRSNGMRVSVPILLFLILPTIFITASISLTDNSQEPTDIASLGVVLASMLYMIGVLYLLMRLLKRLYLMLTRTDPAERVLKGGPPRFQPETDKKSEYWKKNYSGRRKWLTSLLETKLDDKVRKSISEELAQLDFIFSDEKVNKKRVKEWEREEAEERQKEERQKEREREERRDEEDGRINEKIICKICEEKGAVRPKNVSKTEWTKEYGVIGAKGTSKSITGTKYSCDNCGQNWFEQGLGNYY